MKVYDLRLDNYVLFENEVCYVRELGYHMITVSPLDDREVIEATELDIQGVPFSKEIFEKNNHLCHHYPPSHDSYALFFEGYGYLTFYWYETEQEWLGGGWDDKDDTFITTRYAMRYVHQLQNFFFALYGEELTIKL